MSTKDPAYRKIDDEILGSAFNYLVRQGLENTSIRDLCKGTGISLGSIYYWFSSKEEMICDAAEYGLKKVADEIFEYAFNSMGNLKHFFDHCLEEISRFQNELRFIYQMAASPVYGEKMRNKGNDLTFIYNKYAGQLAVLLRCDVEQLRPLVYLFISTVLDYIVWEDMDKSKMQLGYIYEALSTQLYEAKAAI